MLLPPDFILIKCLGLRLDVEGRREIARIVGRGEPCVRMWQRNDSFPDEAFQQLTGYFEYLGAKNFAEEINKVMERPYLGILGETKWKMFCQGMLLHENIFLSRTLQEILRYSEQQIIATQSIKDLKLESRFDAYREYLSDTLAEKFNMPASLKSDIAGCSDWDGLRPIQAWLVTEALIYFLSMAEAEYLQCYFGIHESKIALWGLPARLEGKFKYPVKVFFDQFFDRLIEKGYHTSLDSIAEKIPRIEPLTKAARKEGKSRAVLEKDSGWREMKRAKYEGKAPSFETFTAWINALVPKEIYDSEEDFVRERQMLCDGLGAVKILDGFCRDIIKEISEEQLLSHFAKYVTWFEFHSSRFKKSEGGSSAPPS